ncbi:MAG: helix-turn-helix transcriptional regulator, partial [Verrucomicrobiae bacterium]|nr:helix-turn-helix transcriptional regulator [Verrucomicrobiae bacterium]
LRGDPAARWNVAALARRVGMSASAFAHAYPRVAGETPHRAILRLKIEAAKKLLLDQRLRVKETAERLGFSSEFHFSRAFKRLEGVPPRDYRPALLRRRV